MIRIVDIPFVHDVTFWYEVAVIWFLLNNLFNRRKSPKARKH
jgi:hypothetical protein